MVFLLSLWCLQHLWRGWAARLPHLISRYFLFLSLCFILYQCECFITVTCLIWLHHQMLTLFLLLSLVTFILLVPYQSSQCFTHSLRTVFLFFFFQDSWKQFQQKTEDSFKKSLKEYNNVFILMYSRYTLGQKCGWGPSPKVENCRGIIEFCGKFFHLWFCSVFVFRVYVLVLVFFLNRSSICWSTGALVDHLVWVPETFHVFSSRWLQTTSWQ